MEVTPTEVFTNKSPGFNDKKFPTFCSTVGIHLYDILSSTTLINGYIENYVWTLKNALTKAKVPHFSLPRVLLYLRSTPLVSNLSALLRSSMADRQASVSPKENQLLCNSAIQEPW